MAYKIIKKIASRANYGQKRSKVEWIVIHYTANDGDKAASNANYFEKNIVKASAHYFVDDTTVYLTVPEEYAAYAVGDKRSKDYNITGGARYCGTIKNANSISVELCDTIKNGVVYPSAKTIKNALELSKSLMKKYNLPASHIVRHFDVTGKHCPAYWCAAQEKNKKWKTEFWYKLGNPWSEPVKTIRQGAKGDSVKWLQWALDRMLDFGYIKGKEIIIDGKCGPKTISLLKDFQDAYPETGTDGKPDASCGIKTRAKLAVLMQK